MKVSDLKAGDHFYGIESGRVETYTYLSIFPGIADNYYHILATPGVLVVTIGTEKLQEILDQNLMTRKDADLKLALLLEERAEKLRARYYL